MPALAIGCPVETNRYSAAISATAKTGGTMRAVHRFAKTTLTLNSSVRLRIERGLLD